MRQDPAAPTARGVFCFRGQAGDKADPEEAVGHRDATLRPIVHVGEDIRAAQR